MVKYHKGKSNDFFEKSETHFYSAKILILEKNTNPCTMLSGAFLFHLSFELFLKGWMCINKEEYIKTHLLTKLTKGLPHNNLEQNIAEAVLYGEHLLRYTSSTLRKELYNLGHVDSTRIFQVALDDIQRLHEYRYDFGDIGNDDYFFLKCIYDTMRKTFEEQYPDHDFSRPTTDKEEDCIRKYKESQDKHNNLSQEEKDRILSDCYNKDDKRWAEITKIYEESQNCSGF